MNPDPPCTTRPPAGPTGRSPSVRARLESALKHLWFDPPERLARAVVALLMPASWMVSRIAQRNRHRIARRKAAHPADARARVVVIGNLLVGGTGKTPLIIATAQALAQRGWRVGLLARGHGGLETSHGAHLMPYPIPHDAAHRLGDEAALLARITGLPLALGHDRGSALQALLAHHDCTVVLSDDGLQHTGLARDLEIAVFDARGAGNGRVLPAGPLREPLFNALLVDAIALNGADSAPPIQHSRVFRFSVSAQRCLRLDGQEQFDLKDAARRWQGRRVHALAGIGQPGRFFDDLRQAGLDPVCWALADHAPIHRPWVEGLQADIILMTSKDAVKCADWPAALRERCHEVTARAMVEPGFIDWLEERLRGSQMD